MKHSKAFKEYFYEVKQIVDYVDPVKIGYISEDEYDNESYAIAHKTYNKKLSKSQISEIVKEVFVYFFSEDYISDEESEKIGEEIYKILTF
ncbi:conserved hypothetical protein [Nautilia profundicola AmH]|uniref:Uncharacterized protein n=1 Tax=Nautilia profundicola (strain ATCC BAA-1463 / DSM 18972 / AmH) TaxID=598659 RepID=B9L864_NAUPA|nr:hypothetical protein [Nautilia profundicola]ACM93245.1 conserved hypothetical protein [Nautilia profundicola AmH]